MGSSGAESRRVGTSSSGRDIVSAADCLIRTTRQQSDYAKHALDFSEAFNINLAEVNWVSQTWSGSKLAGFISG